MRSKTPPPSHPVQDDPAADDLLNRPTPSEGPAASLLLRRIAEALQVPLSTLYRPPNAVGAGSPSEVVPDSECEALLHAYRRIPDPEMRRRLLTLMQAAAEQT